MRVMRPESAALLSRMAMVWVLYGRGFPRPLLWVYASGVAEDVG
ncbi:hypothetical protein [Actinomadura sp. KC06]|nr:hypothetical protein [Actinomadura sp. KC06]